MILTPSWERICFFFAVFTPLFITIFVEGQTPPVTGGVLSEDTRWTEQDSPITLTANLLVSEGVTLTIDPGVEVELDGRFIQVDGTLRALGEPSNLIVIKSSIHRDQQESTIHFTSTSTPWEESTGNGSIIEYATIELLSQVSILVNSSSPKISHCTITNGSDTLITVMGTSSPIISDNLLSDNAREAIALRFTDDGLPVIERNVFSGNGSGIDMQRSAGAVIQDNLFIGHHYGIHIDNGSNSTQTLTIRRNTFVQNTSGIKIEGSRLLTATQNNFLNQSFNIEIVDGGDPPIDLDATNNWWGTTDLVTIKQRINGFDDDFRLSKVLIDPVLLGPVADLSISLVSGAESIGAGGNLTYTLSMFNNAPVDVPSVTVTDTLPTNSSFISANSSQGGCIEEAKTVTCDLGTVAASSTVTVDIVVKVSVPGMITNTASVEAPGLDLVPSNNTSSVNTTVVGVLTLLFPQFANGEIGETENKTRIVLRNNGDILDSGAVIFRNSTGEFSPVPINNLLTEVVAYSLPPWGSVEIQTDGTGDLQTGVIEVISQVGVESALEGTVIFELY